jgi:hypothetical protein
MNVEGPLTDAPRRQGGPRGEFALVLDTPRGPFVRTVPSASPLDSDLRQGSAAEVATQNAAAVWGLPDFVYLPEIKEVGSGTRELGDGFIIVGGLAIVMQVKSRESPTTDVAKESGWLEKKASEGLAQGTGTIRLLRRGPVDLTNLRGNTVRVDATSHRWLVVVVLDHADPPEGVRPSLGNQRHPAVVLLRRDWEFLFDQLKSTHAVAHYLDRVAGEELPLGEEPVRYYDLAEADAEAPPGEFPPEFARVGRVISGPLLPMAPVALEDRREHVMVRSLFEDIAITHLKTSSEQDRLRILAELDRLAVTQRAEIGRFVLKAMETVSETKLPGVVWRMRSVRGGKGHAHLGFGACSHPYTEEVAHAFALWTQLRHRDVLEVTNEISGLTTVAVLVTPRNDGIRPWDTSVAAVSGPVEFGAQDLEVLRELFPGPAAAA